MLERQLGARNLILRMEERIAFTYLLEVSIHSSPELTEPTVECSYFSFRHLKPNRSICGQSIEEFFGAQLFHKNLLCQC